MKIAKDIYLVGSGEIRLSHPNDCHVYLIDGGGELALVDGGVGLAPDMILDNIKEDGFNINNVKYILLTHAHSDHANGAGKIRKALGCAILATKEEAWLAKNGDDFQLGLVAAKRDACYPQDFHFDNYKVDQIIEDNEEITVGKYKLRIIVVPGHRTGHACYLMSRDGYTILFSGDTVFRKGMISLLNCPGSSLKEYRENIEKLSNLSVDALLPGHKLWTLKDGQNHINLAIQRLKAMFPPLNTGVDNDLRVFMLEEGWRGEATR